MDRFVVPAYAENTTPDVLDGFFSTLNKFGRKAVVQDSWSRGGVIFKKTQPGYTNEELDQHAADNTLMDSGVAVPFNNYAKGVLLAITSLRFALEAEKKPKVCVPTTLAGYAVTPHSEEDGFSPQGSVFVTPLCGSEGLSAGEPSPIIEVPEY